MGENRALLLRMETALEECAQHLAAASAAGTAIESYLAEHILVVLVADMQTALYDVASVRAQDADRGLKEFVEGASRRILRSVRKEEIASFVAFWGRDAKQAFNDRLDERVVAIYNNAVQQRHEVAHRFGSTITFHELRGIVEAAREILEAATSALSANR